MSDQFNPRNIFNINEHGDPFSTIDQGIDFLQNKIENAGVIGLVSAQYLYSGTTRYAVNQITQHTEFGEITFTLSLNEGKRLSRGSTTVTTEEGLEELFDTLQDSLKKSPEIDFYQGFPESKPSELKDLSSPEWSIEERTDTVIEAINSCEEIEKNVIVSGTCSTSRNYNRVVNSFGLDVDHSGNSNYFKVNAIIESPEDRNHRGYGQEDLNFRFEKPNVDSLSKSATRTARETLTLIDLPAQSYEVVLGQQAVSDLFVFAQFSLDPTSFHETNSFASDNLGAQIFDPKITVADKPRDPQLANLVRLFDFEGLPSEDKLVVDRGVLQSIPYDSFTAAKYLGDKNLATGNTLEFFGNVVPIYGSCVWENGDNSTEDLINEIDDGLWVKNFWYNRFTKRREGGLTGLTRNGLYQVKNGEIVGAVRNLRYTDSFVRAFSPGNVLNLSSDRRMFQLNTTPSVHLETFNFSSVAHTNKIDS